MGDSDLTIRGIYVGPVADAKSQELCPKAQTRELDYFTVQSFERGMRKRGEEGIESSFPIPRGALLCIPRLALLHGLVVPHDRDALLKEHVLD